MRFPVLVLLGALIAAAPAHAVRVSADHDEEADFSRYHTYTRVAGTPAKSELNQKRLDAALDSQLAAKGLTKVDEGGDLQVVTHVASDKSTRVQIDDFGYSYYSGYWGRRGMYDTTRSVTVYDVVEGSIVVDLVDAASGQLVWRGTATDTMSPNIKPEKVTKIINKAMEKLFQKYPPAK